MNLTQTNLQKLQSENARLNHLVAELKLLNDLSIAMSSTMDLQEIMVKIITKAIETIGAEQGTIMLVEAHSAETLKTVIRGVREEHQGKIYKLGTYLSGWMLKTRQPLLANDVSHDARLRGLGMEQTGICSILCTPMLHRGTLIGVINLFNKCDGAQFTDDDQKLMSIIASQVASFLSNARTFEEVQNSRDQLQRHTNHLRREVGARYGFAGIIGTSQKIMAVQEAIKAIIKTPASVLIIGETGTGKELVAKTIHYNSDRQDKPFVDVNSAALPENLVESELFGIEAGAATGVKKRIGLFEQANGGTLFIDEIGDMSLAAQSKILRVLQERQIRRVGSNLNIGVDLRLIAATNKNLAAEISKGTFREDLYYRLCVFELELPPLRERREDIPLLTEHFAQLHADRMGKVIKRFSPEATEILCSHDWPGNVRELANVVERTVILAKNAIIGVEHLPSEFQRQAEPTIPFGQSFEEAVNNFKKRLLLKCLAESNQNKAEAARQLQISRTYLFRLMKQLGVKGD